MFSPWTPGLEPSRPATSEGDTFADVAPHVRVHAQVIDVSGDLVVPGFIDSHRHTWEGSDFDLHTQRHTK